MLAEARAFRAAEIDPSWAHRPSARSRAGGAFPIAVAIVSTLCP